MKNLFFALISLSVIFSTSCSKDEDAVANSQLQTIDENVPAFKQDDLLAASWNELPDELKNATELKPSELKVSYGQSDLWGDNAGTFFGYIRPVGSTLYAMGARAGSVVDGIIVWYKTSSGEIVYYQYGGTGGILNYFIAGANESIKAVWRTEENFYGTLCIGGFGVHSQYRTVIWGDNFSSGLRAGWTWANGEVVGLWGYSGNYINGLAFFDAQ